MLSKAAEKSIRYVIYDIFFYFSIFKLLSKFLIISWTGIPDLYATFVCSIESSLVISIVWKRFTSAASAILGRLLMSDIGRYDLSVK